MIQKNPSASKRKNVRQEPRRSSSRREAGRGMEEYGNDYERDGQRMYGGDQVRGVVEVLNGLLANEYSLFTKTLNFHWNVTGKRFHTLHTFLGAEYRELLELMDEVAERVRILGFRPLSTVSEMLSVTTLHESPGRVPSADKMLNELLGDHMAIQRYLRQALSTEVFEQDPSTEDFVLKILQKHEKTGWMLRSHIIDEGLN